MSDTEKRKTLLFERKYNVNIDDFSSTTDIDDFIETKEGTDLRHRKKLRRALDKSIDRSFKALAKQKKRLQREMKE